MEEERNYQVVLEYTSEAGGFKGNRFRTDFNSKEAFDKWYTPDVQKKQKAIAQGVSDSEGLELCEQVPAKCLISACLQAAADSRGRVNRRALRMELGTVLLSAAYARQEKEGDNPADRQCSE